MEGETGLHVDFYRTLIYIMKVLLLVLTTLFYFFGFSQLNYQEGSVVLRSGEVLKGSIADRKEGFRTTLLKKIKVKQDGKLFSQSLKPKDIERYNIGSDSFLSIPIQRNTSLFKTEIIEIGKGNYTLFKVIETGPLSLLIYEYVDPENGYVETIPYLKKANDSRLVRATQGVFGLKRKSLVSFLQDCPELVELIENKKITTPVEVVTFYNNWKEKLINPQ
jgi:hypothetical protein